MNGGSVRETGRFPIDTTLLLTGTFVVPQTGQLQDPTVITLFLSPPSQPQLIIPYTGSGGAIIRASVGVYQYILTPNASGKWLGTWQGIGVLDATRDFSFLVWSSVNIAG